jgi:hypothetical protein
MSGRGIRLYTDEDVDPDLADQLGRLGYDALSCHVAGNHNQSLDDEWQLRFAVSQGRAILVFNIVDFLALDRAWRGRGDEHSGIILAQAETPIGELVRRTRIHLDTYDPQYQHNLVLYLA